MTLTTAPNLSELNEYFLEYFIRDYRTRYPDAYQKILATDDSEEQIRLTLSPFARVLHKKILDAGDLRTGARIIVSDTVTRSDVEHVRWSHFIKKLKGD